MSNFWTHFKPPQVFRIHPLTSEDIQLEETREKLEPFREYNFLVFRSFEQDRLSPHFLQPINIYVVIFAHGIISVSGAPVLWC